MATERINSATRRILLSRIASSGLRPLVDAFNRSDRIEAFLCAGAVRDAFLSALGDSDPQPRDFDIGVKGTTKKEFRQIASRFGGTRNRYDGVRVQVKPGISADLWRIEDTVGIRLTNSSPEIENVLRSFVLDVNALAFNLRTQEFIDRGAVASLTHRTIDLVSDALLHDPGTFAARAILLALRLAFDISDRLEQFTLANFDSKVFKYELAKLPQAWDAGGRCIRRGDLIASNAHELIAIVRQRSLSARPPAVATTASA